MSRKLNILLLILGASVLLLLSNREKRAVRGGESLRASYTTELYGSRNNNIPFLVNTVNKGVEYYQSSYMAIRIEEVKVDGVLLEPKSEYLSLNEFIIDSFKSTEDMHVHIMNFDEMITVLECSAENYSAVMYVLPDKYDRVEITYKVRTSAGLSEQVNAIVLRAESGRYL